MNTLPRKRTSLREVALASKTSVATVSRVLNNTGYIAELTRVRVLKAAEELNYQPNLRAKGLRQQHSHTIGLLIPNLLNAYYTALADAISQLLTKSGYQLLLSSTRDDLALEQTTLLQLIGHDVDGLIWVPTTSDHKLVDVLLSQNIPAISIVRRVDGARLDTIVFEDLAGAHAATQYLIQLGHRRIGYIGGDVSFSSNYERWQGYLQALKEAGLDAQDELILIGSVRDTWGATAIDRLMQLADPPTAIFVGSNAIIPGVMKTLQQRGVQIPAELSLICFDDLDWFSYSNPSISAVSTSHMRIAEAAVNRLLQRIENPAETDNPPIFTRISFELILRNSTVPPRSSGSSFRQPSK
jgi:LacI family transcriptional regulator